MAQVGRNMLPSGCFLEVFIDVLEEYEYIYIYIYIYTLFYLFTNGLLVYTKMFWGEKVSLKDFLKSMEGRRIVKK